MRECRFIAAISDIVSQMFHNINFSKLLRYKKKKKKWNASGCCLKIINFKVAPVSLLHRTTRSIIASKATMFAFIYNQFFVQCYRMYEVWLTLPLACAAWSPALSSSPQPSARTQTTTWSSPGTVVMATRGDAFQYRTSFNATYTYAVNYCTHWTILMQCFCSFNAGLLFKH